MTVTPGLLLSVAVGGALGAVARYVTGWLLHVLWQGPFPFGTLFVNIVGSAAIGVLFVALDRAVLHPDLRGVLVVGFLGAFTTFSTFSVEAVNLLAAGHVATAVGYTVASVAGCLLATAMGMALGRLLFVLP